MSTPDKIPPLPALISVEEAAKILGLKRASAYRYAAAGELPVKRFGRRVYVVRAKLADMLPPDGEAAA
ncbi:excisionase family DNA binding protein [Kibdelosporangium banguiense]|uniref:Excisionase family DNA binding protein n=1 Tax=Kibdelosporangium banguiense TaxID=1365924 RepID=A0ABS4U367_9PSEU|nr:helix-turn-helix domain-containing protein [Kibdelosporangium banguiense]MBP2330639.1 excisionase family DNA binding protein [Kibdelosporangium banguiense]